MMSLFLFFFCNEKIYHSLVIYVISKLLNFKYVYLMKPTFAFKIRHRKFIKYNLMARTRLLHIDQGSNHLEVECKDKEEKKFYSS